MNRILKFETTVLTVLLWPMIKIEDRFIGGLFAERFGEPSTRIVFAHLERWFFMVLGILTVTSAPILAVSVALAYPLAVIADPVIWVWKQNLGVVTAEDLKLSAVVNLAIIYMFAVGLIVGSTLASIGYWLTLLIGICFSLISVYIINRLTRVRRRPACPARIKRATSGRRGRRHYLRGEGSG